MPRGTIKVSDAELELLQLLWEESPLGAAEIAERAPAARRWQLPTIKTLLSRLTAKGAVRAEAEGRRFLYSPAIGREAVAGSEAGRLVDRLFGGRVSPLVAQLVEQRDISAEDLAELQAIIERMKK